MISIFNNKRLFHPDTVRYITQLASGRPSFVHQKRIDDLVCRLKQNNNWALIDRLWILAHPVQQLARVSLVNPSSTEITEVNSPTWTANQGYTGNGTSSYINCNFNPFTQGINFSLNNGGASIRVQTNEIEDKTCFGNLVSSPTALTISSEFSGSFLGRINANTNLSYLNANAIGTYTLARTASNSTTGYKNGISQASDAVLSVSIPNNNIFLCCGNVNGTPSSFSTKQYSMLCIHSGNINALTFYNAIEEYMTSIGL